MGLFFRLAQGWWRCWSEKDPRWNMDGRGNVGLFTMPEMCRLALDQKKKELASDPPDDLEWAYTKD